MEKILISACLIGDKVKYDGKSNYNPLIKELLEYYELVPMCPEMEGGLTSPRDPCELVNGKVLTQKGRDCTHQYLEGAEKVYNVCLYLGIRTAILKDKSPSCGSTTIYDGSFSHREIKSLGVTAKLLKEKGIRIIPDTEIEKFLEETKQK